MKKILLAINDAFLINVYAKELRKHGFSISIASDTEMAINRAKNSNPDLLVLDAGLPNAGGLDVFKKIREDLGMKNLNIIMLSNFSHEEQIKNNSSGAIKYFLKTENTAEDLAKGIKRILS